MDSRLLAGIHVVATENRFEICIMLQPAVNLTRSVEGEPVYDRGWGKGCVPMMPKKPMG